jgi:hypothetical protein
LVESKLDGGSASGEGAMRTFHLLRLCTAIVLGVLCLTNAWAQTPATTCDDRLRAVAGNQGYQARKTTPRCEGMYESPVRAINLEVVSLLFGKLAFDVEHDDGLVISARAAPGLIDGDIHVRAVALPLKTYYRMDASIAPGGQLQWPIRDVLRPEGLRHDRIGVFGWVGDQADIALVPLVVRTEAANVSAGDIAELRLRTPVDLERVRWRVRSDDGTVADATWTPLAIPSVRGGETFAVRLPAGPAAKLRVDFSAKRPNMDQPLTISLRIIKPGP